MPRCHCPDRGWEGGQENESKPGDRVCVVGVQVFGGENGCMDGNGMPFMIRESLTFERLPFFASRFNAALSRTDGKNRKEN